MSRAVYIGGFGNGKKLAEGVSGALVGSGRYEDADHFTFADAMKNPDKVRKAVKNVDVVTHSAGLLAVKGAAPKEIVAVGAPLPSSIPRLVYGTGKKSLRMAGHSLSGSEAFRAVNNFNASSVGELVRHPVGNLRHLGEIADANAIQMAADARDAGIPAWLFYNEQDDYFRLKNEHHTLAHSLGIQLHMLPGQHDQLPLYPAEILEAVYEVK